MKRTKTEAVTPHFHKREDRYNGGWRLHKYGDPGDYFDMVPFAEMETQEQGLRVPVVDISDDDDAESCHLCYPKVPAR